ncbi:MAG: single-stranded DNA-binding protein [Flavobacteriales bacterium]|nr:single-stranded DNA-binding protein [Flavobacteriales bacterium]
MYTLVNKVQLIGRLGNAPEIKETKNGKKLAKFSIATDESYRDTKGEKVENTQWHRIVAWDRNAEIAEKFLKKGQQIAVDGRLITGSYEDKEGNRRYTVDINVNEFMMLGNKNRD